MKPLSSAVMQFRGRRAALPLNDAPRAVAKSPPHVWSPAWWIDYLGYGTLHAVAATIANYASNGRCILKQETIAKRLSVTRATINEAVHFLWHSGIIEAIEARLGGASEYRLCLDFSTCQQRLTCLRPACRFALTRHVSERGRPMSAPADTENIGNTYIKQRETKNTRTGIEGNVAEVRGYVAADQERYNLELNSGDRDKIQKALLSGDDVSDWDPVYV